MKKSRAAVLVIAGCSVTADVVDQVLELVDRVRLADDAVHADRRHRIQIGASVVVGIGAVEGVECMLVANDPTVIERFRREAIAAWNRGSPIVKRGIALTPVMLPVR